MIINLVIVFFALLIGLAWGSFLNVLSQRPRNTNKKDRTLMGRSFCDSCKHPLGPLDLVPVFSFLFLRGKCRYCGKKIPLKNLFVEVVTAVLFSCFALYLTKQGFDSAADYLQAGIISLIFLIFTYLVSYDIWWLEIPLVPTIAILLLAIIYRGVSIAASSDYSFYFLLYSLAPVVFMVLINFIYQQQAFGAGDYFIIFSLALTLNAKGLFIALEGTILTAAIVGVLYALKIGKFKGVQVPLVPFLVIGWLISLNFSSSIINLIFPS